MSSINHSPQQQPLATNPQRVLTLIMEKGALINYKQVYDKIESKITKKITRKITRRLLEDVLDTELDYRLDY